MSHEIAAVVASLIAWAILVLVIIFTDSDGS